VLGLEQIANRVIGTNAADGISADQRKRLTIGVEMAADPALLFLDEVRSSQSHSLYSTHRDCSSVFPVPASVNLTIAVPRFNSLRRAWTRLAPRG
jgi:ABC-type uncharacterized transport system YnjBCD ATPase subunit